MHPREFAIDLARKAGALMKQSFTLGMKKQWKADDSPVTETDLAINRMLIEAVQKHFPTHGVLAEEESAPVAGAEDVWVCDPVDGTIAFSHGTPTFVYSLALVHKGQSILGVVYDPILDRMVVAEHGKGAELNGEPIHVSPARSMKSIPIGVGWWMGGIRNLGRLETELVQRGAYAMRLGSITYMGMLVALGEFAGTFFTGPDAHDTAALKVIIEEAGGKVTDLFGNEQRYDKPIRGHIASNGILHDELVALVRDFSTDINIY